MKWNKELQELVEAEVIDAGTARAIESYYRQKTKESPNRIMLVFSILGALLVGLGIILIIAHNWDQIPRSTKTIIAFIPLLLSQVLVAIALVRKGNQVAWRESSGSFLILSIGACISLVSQIYHIEGSPEDFLLSWILLATPVMYLLRSSMSSLLFLLGASLYGTSTFGYGPESYHFYAYWLIFLLWMPYWISLLRKQPEGNFTRFHNWMALLSLTVCFSKLSHEYWQLLAPLFLSFFSLIYSLPFLFPKHLKSRAFRWIGQLGLSISLLVLSFDLYWEKLRSNPSWWDGILYSPEFLAAALLLIPILAIYLGPIRQRGTWKRDLSTHAFLIIWLLLIFFHQSPLVAIAVNLVILSIGINIVWQSSRESNLAQMNYGLVLISALIAARFFDAELSFILRGLLFLAVGMGFFIANYSLIRKSKRNA